jgi:DNA-binding NarL/FixJ family response regulator
MSPIRVLLADDHEAVVEDIRELLEPEFDVVGTVRDGAALVREARRLVPDIVVADVSMPHLSGIEAGERILRDQPGIKLVILTMHEDSALVDEALGAGASGYVIKAVAGEELVPAIHAAVEGRRFVSPKLEASAEHLARPREGERHI